jgi:hypothetical protein
MGTVGHDEAGEDETSLEKVEGQVIKKYDELIKGNVDKGNLALKDIIKREINGKKTKIQLTVLVISSLGAVRPKMFGKIRRLSGGANKQKVSLILKRMVMAALKGTRVCWLKQNGWWNEPKDNNDQFLEMQMNEIVTRYEEDNIAFENEDKGIADITHEALMDELSVSEAADNEEVELNTRAESEEDFDLIMGIPIDETPFRYWSELFTRKLKDSYMEMTTPEEQMSIYKLGFGKDDVEEEADVMTSSDDDVPGRSWSDGIWIVTPSDNESQQFSPHSE